VSNLWWLAWCSANRRSFIFYTYGTDVSIRLLTLTRSVVPYPSKLTWLRPKRRTNDVEWRKFIFFKEEWRILVPTTALFFSLGLVVFPLSFCALLARLWQLTLLIFIMLFTIPYFFASSEGRSCITTIWLQALGGVCTSSKLLVWYPEQRIFFFLLLIWAMP
jgi:hypothetical protein